MVLRQDMYIQDERLNTIASDAMAPFVTRPSGAMVMTM